MKIVIDIPDYWWTDIQSDAGKYVYLNGERQCKSLLQMILNAIRLGIPLPKNHGRLIDADSINQILRPIEPNDTKWGMTAETAKMLIHDAFNKAPTIIEADKEVEE